MDIYIDKNKKDPDAKNGISSKLKYNLEDKIEKRKVCKGFKENNYKINVNF